VLLADRKNGKPLDAKAGPYQVVVPGSAMYERWIRQVRRILVQPASASPFPSQKVAAPEAAAKDGRRGGVYLVGTGPGAPDLITVRAAQVLRSADLVLCYSWMKDELAPFVRPGVVEIASSMFQGGKYIGQKPSDFSGAERDRAASAHEELAKLKARIKGLLKEGKTVVFADNGDPMIFSPWSWVPEQLAELNPTVVPGLSSFNAGNAALKRSVASLGSVIISSGAEMGTPDDKGRLAGTIAFFTHRTKLEELLPKLRQRYPADTPVGIVCDASYPTEKVIHGTLGTILDVLGDKKLPHLYLLYVGDALKQKACCR
jgi:precorrin-4/cobalt-precorrin-4 C11-methyltransferase